VTKSIIIFVTGKCLRTAGLLNCLETGNYGNKQALLKIILFLSRRWWMMK